VNARAKAYLTAPVSVWEYDMNALPTGTKCMLLNQGGVACLGSITNVTRSHFIAWAPMPKRDKERERALGIKV
jgi:hypothetical protein